MGPARFNYQPPKRFPCVQPLYKETYLHAMMRQKVLTDHWRRVDYAKGLVDDGPPHTAVNVRHKLKNMLAQAERLARIERDNRRMLSHIVRALKAPPHVDQCHNRPWKKHHSLHYVKRRQFVALVNRENRALLKRIVKTRPVYNHVTLEKEYLNRIHSNHNQKAVVNMWNRRTLERRNIIMSGKTRLLTDSSCDIDMEALGKRMAETHRDCIPTYKKEQFHARAVPENSRSPEGAIRVDHKRCFSPRPTLPSIKPRTSSSTRLSKHQAKIQIRMTRSEKLRQEAIRKKRQFASASTRPARGQVKQNKDKANTNPGLAKQNIDVNQSAITEDSMEDEDSPYRRPITMDNLGYIKLPPIIRTAASDHSQKAEAEAGLQNVRGLSRTPLPPIPMTSHRLPPIPRSKVVSLPPISMSNLSHNGLGYRQSSMTAADTSISSSSWKSGSYLAPKKWNPQNDGREETKSHNVTVSYRNVPSACSSSTYGRNSQRTLLPFLQHAKDSKAGRPGVAKAFCQSPVDCAPTPGLGDVCDAQQLDTDDADSTCPDTHLSEQETSQARSLGKMTSRKCVRDKRQSDASEVSSDDDENTSHGAHVSEQKTYKARSVGKKSTRKSLRNKCQSETSKAPMVDDTDTAHYGTHVPKQKMYQARSLGIKTATTSVRGKHPSDLSQVSFTDDTDTTHCRINLSHSTERKTYQAKSLRKMPARKSLGDGYWSDSSDVSLSEDENTTHHYRQASGQKTHKARSSRKKSNRKTTSDGYESDVSNNTDILCQSSRMLDQRTRSSSTRKSRRYRYQSGASEVNTHDTDTAPSRMHVSRKSEWKTYHARPSGMSAVKTKSLRDKQQSDASYMLLADEKDTTCCTKCALEQKTHKARYSENKSSTRKYLRERCQPDSSENVADDAHTTHYRDKVSHKSEQKSHTDKSSKKLTNRKSQREQHQWDTSAGSLLDDTDTAHYAIHTSEQKTHKAKSSRKISARKSSRENHHSFVSEVPLANGKDTTRYRTHVLGQKTCKAKSSGNILSTKSSRKKCQPDSSENLKDDTHTSPYRHEVSHKSERKRQTDKSLKKFTARKSQREQHRSDTLKGSLVDDTDTAHYDIHVSEQKSHKSKSRKSPSTRKSLRDRFLSDVSRVSLTDVNNAMPQGTHMSKQKTHKARSSGNSSITRNSPRGIYELDASEVVISSDIDTSSHHMHSSEQKTHNARSGKSSSTRKSMRGTHHLNASRGALSGLSVSTDETLEQEKELGEPFIGTYSVAEVHSRRTRAASVHSENQTPANSINPMTRENLMDLVKARRWQIKPNPRNVEGKQVRKSSSTPGNLVDVGKDMYSKSDHGTKDCEQTPLELGDLRPRKPARYKGSQDAEPARQASRPASETYSMVKPSSTGHSDGAYSMDSLLQGSGSHWEFDLCSEDDELPQSVLDNLMSGDDTSCENTEDPSRKTSPLKEWSCHRTSQAESADEWVLSGLADSKDCPIPSEKVSEDGRAAFSRDSSSETTHIGGQNIRWFHHSSGRHDLSSEED